MKYFLLACMAVMTSLVSMGQGFNSVHSSNGTDVWVAGKSGAIWHSADGGANWTNMTQGVQDLYGLFSLGQSVWAVGLAGICFQTTDGGTTWSASTIGSGATLYSVHFINATTGWVVGAGGAILKTTNAASSWTPQTSPVSSDLSAVDFVDAQTGYAAGVSGVLLKTTDGGTSWTDISPPAWTKDLTSVDALGSRVIVTGVDAVCYASTDAGASWSGLNFATDSQSDVNDVFVLDASTAFFVGGGGYIRKTVDGGSSFQYGLHPLHATLNSIFFFNAQNGWACTGKNNVILRTTNGGANWLMPQGTTFSQLWGQKLSIAGTVRGNAFSISAFNKNMVYVALGTRVYASYNRGDSWVEIAMLPSGGSKVNSFYVSPKDSNLWVAAYGSPDRVVRTTNRGVSWTATITKDFTEYGMPLDMDGSHPDTLYFGPEDGNLYRSTDFGANWVELSRPAFRSPCDIVVVRDSASIIWVGDGITGSGQGQMFRSTDGGLNFSLIYTTSGSEIPTIGSGSLDKSLGYATAWGSGGVTKTTNYGVTWPSVATTGSTWGVDVAKDDPNVVMYGVYGGGTSYLSSSAGSSFATANLSGSNYAILCYDRGTFLAQQSGGIWKLAFTYNVPVSNQQTLSLLSPNGGEVWAYGTMQNITWSAAGIPNVKIDYKTAPASPWQTIVASTPGASGSYAWTIPNAVTMLARVRISDVSDTNPIDSSANYFSITAAGISVAPTEVQFGNVPVGQINIDTITVSNTGNAPLVVSNISFDSTGFSVSRTSFTINAGGSDTLKVFFIPMVVKNYSATMTMTHNAPTSPTAVPVSGVGTTPVAVGDPEVVPLTYALQQNYPNPFNPATTIQYSIPEKSFVTLQVFNSIGQETALLVNESQEPGRYSVRFSSESSGRKSLTSGIYFYKLTAGKFSQTRKMLLLK